MSQWIQSMGTDELDRRFAAPDPDLDAEVGDFCRDMLGLSAEAQEALHRAIRIMPHVEQDIVQLCILGSPRKTQADVGALLGITQPSISWRLHRCIERLRYAVGVPHPSEEDIEMGLAGARIMGPDAETARVFIRTTGASATAKALGTSEGGVRHRLLDIVRRLKDGPPESQALGRYIAAIPMEILAERYCKAHGREEEPDKAGSFRRRRKLDRDALLDRAQRLASVLGEKADGLREYREMSKQHRRHLRALDAVVAGLQRDIADGAEDEVLECREERDVARGVISVVAVESGEVLEERAMTAEERQLKIGEGGPDAG